MSTVGQAMGRLLKVCRSVDHMVVYAPDLQGLAVDQTCCQSDAGYVGVVAALRKVSRVFGYLT